MLHQPGSTCFFVVVLEVEVVEVVLESGLVVVLEAAVVVLEAAVVVLQPWLVVQRLSWSLVLLVVLEAGPCPCPFPACVS